MIVYLDLDSLLFVGVAVCAGVAMVMLYAFVRHFQEK